MTNKELYEKYTDIIDAMKALGRELMKTRAGRDSIRGIEGFEDEDKEWLKRRGK